MIKSAPTVPGKEKESPEYDEHRKLFLQLYANHRALIRSMLQRSLRLQDADVDDLISDTVIRLMDRIGTLVNHATFASWFIISARGLHIRKVTKKKQIRPMLLTTEKIYKIQIAEQVDNNLHELPQALETLSPLFRLPLLLHYMEGRKIKEIAELLSVPLNTVLSRIARAKQKLYSTLNNDERRPSRQSRSRAKKSSS